MRPKRFLRAAAPVRLLLHTAFVCLLAGAFTPARSLAGQAPPRLAGGLDAETGDFLLTLGPIDLPARASHHQVAQPVAQEVVLPEDGWLRGYRLQLVDRFGRPVPQAVVHHLNLMLPGRRELFSGIMLRIGAAGHETAPVELPFLMGFKVKAGEKILVTAMFANEESARAYQGVSLRVRMPFTKDDTWLPPFSVYPFYIDVMPPAGLHAYDLPPGKSQRSWQAQPAAPARILGVGGHLHRFGTLLRFEDVTAGKVLWEARPLLAADGEVAGMPTGKFWWRGGVKVEPTHVYRLTAFYDNPTGKVVPEGAMGTLGGILVPSRGALWPAVNPADPEYRKDVTVTRTGMQMPGMQMPGMQMAPVAPGAAPMPMPMKQMEGHTHAAPAPPAVRTPGTSAPSRR